MNETNEADLTPLRELVRELLSKEKFPDAESQIAEVARRAKKAPWYAELQTTLVAIAVARVVYEQRHAAKRQVRSDLRHESLSDAGGKPSVAVANSKIVNEAGQSFFDSFTLGGKRIGDCTGADLSKIEIQEADAAAGHLFNSRLAAWCLKQGVKDDQCVRDVIPEAKLSAAMKRLDPLANDAKAQAA